MKEIFVTEEPEDNDITRTEILEIIGNSYTKKKDLKKSIFNIEWRFRFYKFKEKTVVEVSCKEPNRNRKYKTKNTGWIYLSDKDEKGIDEIWLL